jgi:hypothetical protein
MTTTQTDERVIVSAQIPRDVRDDLERRAVAADRTLSAEIRRALVAHVERDDEKEEA